MTSPAPAVDLSVTPVAERLLSYYATEIAKVAAPPAVTSLRPGDQVQLLLSTARDECCEGLAWVRIANMFPATAHFPLPDIEYTHCPPSQWGVVLELGAARCAPVPDASSIPTKEQWTAVTRAVLNDGAAMRRAVNTFAAAEQDRMIVPGMWTPLAVDGGCVGSILHITVAVYDSDCP